MNAMPYQNSFLQDGLSTLISQNVHVKPCLIWITFLAGDRPTISFWDIFFVVYIEAFLWGAGTAIGELPPYFVAKAASLAGKKDEELQQLEEGGGIENIPHS